MAYIYNNNVSILVLPIPGMIPLLAASSIMIPSHGYIHCHSDYISLMVCSCGKFVNYISCGVAWRVMVLMGTSSPS